MTPCVGFVSSAKSINNFDEIFWQKNSHHITRGAVRRGGIPGLTHVLPWRLDIDITVMLIEKEFCIALKHDIDCYCKARLCMLPCRLQTMARALGDSNANVNISAVSQSQLRDSVRVK